MNASLSGVLSINFNHSSVFNENHSIAGSLHFKPQICHISQITFISFESVYRPCGTLIYLSILCDCRNFGGMNCSRGIPLGHSLTNSCWWVEELWAGNFHLFTNLSKCYIHDDVIKWKKKSALLALFDENPPVTGGFPSQRPLTRSFDVFFDLCLNKQVNKQSRRRWFETPSRSLWRHCTEVCGNVRTLLGAHKNAWSYKKYQCVIDLFCFLSISQTLSIYIWNNSYD